MSERTKNYLYLYFGIGYLWAIFAGFIQLTLFEDISFWLYMFAFGLNMLTWPLSMLSALYYFLL